MGFFSVLRKTAALSCRRASRAINASLNQSVNQQLVPSLLAVASLEDSQAIDQACAMFIALPAPTQHTTTSHVAAWKRLVDGASTAEKELNDSECLEDGNPCDDIQPLPIIETPPLILNTEQGFPHIAVGLSHAVEYEEVKGHAIELDDEDDFDDEKEDDGQDDARNMHHVQEPSPDITPPLPPVEQVTPAVIVLTGPITSPKMITPATATTPARPKIVRDEAYYAKMWSTRHVAWTPIEGEVATFDAASVQALRAARLAVEAQPARSKDNWYGC